VFFHIPAFLPCLRDAEVVDPEVAPGECLELLAEKSAMEYPKLGHLWEIHGKMWKVFGNLWNIIGKSGNREMAIENTMDMGRSWDEPPKMGNTIVPDMEIWDIQKVYTCIILYIYIKWYIIYKWDIF
jgi:hypothetical protein